MGEDKDFDHLTWLLVENHRLWKELKAERNKQPNWYSAAAIGYGFGFYADRFQKRTVVTIHIWGRFYTFRLGWL